ncbi:MAG: dethiobiotin synthase [Bacteroidia bacterium]
MRRIFVTGIGTDVGKTVVSAVLVEAMQADYWKPVQTGADFGTDTETVRRLISNSKSVMHPESYKFTASVAPYAASVQENKPIDLDSIKMPHTDNHLVIEGAGGLLVPITDKYFMMDLIMKLDAEVVLVVQNYLGSINHSLLSCEYLKSKGVKVAGIIITGTENAASEEIILKHSGFPLLGKVKREVSINQEVIKKYADIFAANFQ